MAKFISMSPESSGFRVLMRLHQVGGSALIIDLLSALTGEFRTVARFHQIALPPIASRGLARLVKDKGGDRLQITGEGELFIGSYLGSIALVRTSASTKPLDWAKTAGFRETRPGAFEYRSIPSRMGDERIPFVKVTNKAEGK